MCKLYFPKKFTEDGLYPAPKRYLAEAVSEHLKPISYDRWARLYWKRELEEGLSAAETVELAALERENMKTIEDVYQRLQGDSEVQALVDRIKGHGWVQVIEGK